MIKQEGLSDEFLRDGSKPAQYKANKRSPLKLPEYLVSPEYTRTAGGAGRVNKDGSICVMEVNRAQLPEYLLGDGRVRIV